MARLSGKVALITGGASGIGLAAAHRFAGEGTKVVIGDIDAAAAEAACEATPGLSFQPLDVTSDSAWRSAVDRTVARHGRLDVLVANAGTPAEAAPVVEFDTDEFDRTFAVHVRGVFLLCKYGLRVLSDGGSVVIVSSVAGLRADPGVVAYVAAKHAQVGLMRSVAKEVAPRGIRVNTIHPGPVANAFQAGIEERLTTMLGTDATAFLDRQIPLGRHAQPEEIAASVLYLASKQSSFTTASTLVVDGGMSA